MCKYITQRKIAHHSACWNTLAHNSLNYWCITETPAAYRLAIGKLVGVVKIDDRGQRAIVDGAVVFRVWALTWTKCNATVYTGLACVIYLYSQSGIMNSTVVVQ